jgi:outer membrane protein assembly factor BamB
MEATTMSLGKRIWTTAALLTGFLATGPAGRADDWPQWLGPQRDGVWRETGILATFPKDGPVVRWRQKISAGYAGPAVAQGKVFVMDRILGEGVKNPADFIPMYQRKGIKGNERVLCYGEADGKLLWKREYDCPYTVSYPLGPRTTPVISDGKVYTLGTEGHLFCLDTGTGKVLWGRDLRQDYKVKAPLWGFSAHLLLDGQRLISMVGGKGSTVVAFDKNTGKELWRALSASEPGYCPPMIYQAGGKRQLIVWDADALSGLDPETGKVYWSQPAAPQQGMSIATPRMVGNELFITGYPRLAMMLRLHTDRPSVEVLWKNSMPRGLFAVFGTPFFEDGHIYGSSNGQFGCIKAADGERVWETTAPNGGKKAPSGDVFIVKNGNRFFLAAEKGDLIIARLSPKGYEEVSRAHLLEPTSKAFGRDVVWSHPAFANRCLFARNDQEILCVSLAEGDRPK